MFLGRTPATYDKFEMFSSEPGLEKSLDKSMWTAIYDYDAQGI